MATRKDRRRDRAPPEENNGDRSSAHCAGDTLPWNLSKHQRVIRSKSASGDVLDPAERAVIRIAGLWGQYRRTGRGQRSKGHPGPCSSRGATPGSVTTLHPAPMWLTVDLHFRDTSQKKDNGLLNVVSSQTKLHAEKMGPVPYALPHCTEQRGVKPAPSVGDPANEPQ
ncbi:putative plectin-like [Scophthalmus maximus]|uniref:Putative plectin-like n=1 Tax=Scophthalmus maximus TaxID=52904 RepID=A0A2U9AZM3_SCOMX|nr:putative plectin-like [Scophthalmus maximus]